MIKPRRVDVSDGSCVMRSTLRTWKIELSDVRSIKIGRVLSLVDEIGVILESRIGVFYVDEATSGFMDFVRWANIEDLVGKDWYSQAENETIVLKMP